MVPAVAEKKELRIKHLAGGSLPAGRIVTVCCNRRIERAFAGTRAHAPARFGATSVRRNQRSRIQPVKYTQRQMMNGWRCQLVSGQKSKGRVGI